MARERILDKDLFLDFYRLDPDSALKDRFDNYMREKAKQDLFQSRYPEEYALIKESIQAAAQIGDKKLVSDLLSIKRELINQIELHAENESNYENVDIYFENDEIDLKRSRLRII